MARFSRAGRAHGKRSLFSDITQGIHCKAARTVARFYCPFIIAMFLLMGAAGTVGARAYFASPDSAAAFLSPKVALADLPNKQYRIHDIGRIGMMVTNFGTFGSGYVQNAICGDERCPSCEYPMNSNLQYLYSGAIWIGAVVGHDTLVSVGAEGWYFQTELLPDPGVRGDFVSRSNLQSRIDYSEDAISEQDFICTYTDTFTDMGFIGENFTDPTPHRPLNIAVRQGSYSWSYDYAEDFVIFDYQITNIGQYPIQNMYMGIFIDGDVSHNSLSWTGYLDDICGFRRTVDMFPGYGFDKDTVNIAWLADNDGDPEPDGEWSFRSPTSLTGVRVLRTPNDDLKYSFNWWISNGTASLDFGPRLAGSAGDPFRSFGSHLGTPVDDRQKYYLLSHREFDYDQLTTALSHTGEGFLPPPKPYLAENFANGYDARFLLSFGPFDIRPGDSLPISLAYVGGENFHVNPMDFENYFYPQNPDIIYRHLNFEDIGVNARWASWIFDNPGYDTPTEEYPQGDGYAGHFTWICPVEDTVVLYPETEEPPQDIIEECTKKYYTGDGVPDFRGASAPPPPKLRVIPDFGKVTIRWNGQIAENARDFFSNQADFEGYRIYYSEGDRISDFIQLATYDINDYRVFEFDNRYQAWEQNSWPHTLDSLRALFGPTFDPNLYTSQVNYFTDSESGRIMYFVPQDWNQSDLSNPNHIHKIYPEAVKSDSSDTTEEGFLRYYEYEYEINNLQPSKPYYFSVTAFDFGSLNVELGALESSPLVNAVLEYPLPSAEKVEEEGLSVMVYPNPYRIDDGYAQIGYENRDRTKSSERARAIHFINLPNVCTIRIFSIDGDLIQELEHYYPEGGPGSQHEKWNVISRNTQSVVTGIYLWHVESAMGEQIGKLVIMK